jgi:hypothetical protein
VIDLFIVAAIVLMHICSAYFGYFVVGPWVWRRLTKRD